MRPRALVIAPYLPAEGASGGGARLKVIEALAAGVPVEKNHSTGALQKAMQGIHHGRGM